ncbi:MAG TPA: LacI family DNA-binding transcriptional regulator, partial [Micromonosporaceae bacterium]
MPDAGETVTAGRPSMMDVARHVGVSHQTVSRVVNEHPNVRASTREQVLSAMRELGYRPNAAARMLATGRSATIGVIGLNSTLFGPAATMHGVDNAARDARYRLLTVSLDAIDRPSISDAIDRLTSSGADGIIVIAPLSSAREAMSDLTIDVPTVMVNAHPDSRIATVSVDQIRGARLATDHLIATGRGPVWHVAGPLHWTESQDRITGWRQAMAVAGVEASPLLVG